MLYIIAILLIIIILGNEDARGTMVGLFGLVWVGTIVVIGFGLLVACGCVIVELYGYLKLCGYLI